MTALETLILHVYPWWEMQRVRQLSFITKQAEPLPANAWRHTANLIDHKYRGVTTPNCDTLYSGAWLDLAHGPVLIEVPATDLPYWSIAVMDLNTDNLAVMGSRYPDSSSLLVCGQDFAGELPADIPCVRSKSQVVWLLGRYLIGSKALAATSEALRRAVTLSQWPVQGTKNETKRIAAASPLRGKLIPGIRKNAKNFWEVTRATLAEDPALFNHLLRDTSVDPALAWPDGARTWSDLSTDSQTQFSDAYFKTLAVITSNNSGNIQTRGQWRYPGTDIGNFGKNALYRAEVALWGLGALETKEVMYITTLTDSMGVLLNGANHYRFRIPPEGMPALAFWSLTIYKVDPFGGMYFSDNPIQRYAIGDRTDGLHRNEDGAIEIWIGHLPPPLPNQARNWLPAPAGLFRVMLRVYAPTPEFAAARVLPPSVIPWSFQ